jgi:predicted SAM-dependent methyltransferase
MLQVNVGCGEFRAEGWINVDMTKVDGGPQPDIVASALDLPFADGTVDRVYAGHVLEHLMPSDAVLAVKEFRRITKPGGEILVVLPDLDVAEERYPDLVDSVRYGADRWGGDRHLWESRPASFASLLDLHGIDYYRIDLNGLIGSVWPIVAFVDWQYAFEIIK